MLPRACVVRVLCVHDLGCTTLPRACHALGAHCLLCYLWRVCRALGAHCLLPVGPYSARCGPVVSPSPAHRGLSVQCKPLGSRPLQSHLSHLLRAASDALPQQDTDNWNAYSLTSTHTHMHTHALVRACMHAQQAPDSMYLGARCVPLQMASALQHIHALGLAHLDLKPDNIYRARPAPNSAASASWSGFKVPRGAHKVCRCACAYMSLWVRTRCARVLICHCGCVRDGCMRLSWRRKLVGSAEIAQGVLAPLLISPATTGQPRARLRESKSCPPLQSGMRLCIGTWAHADTWGDVCRAPGGLHAFP